MIYHGDVIFSEFDRSILICSDALNTLVTWAKNHGASSLILSQSATNDTYIFTAHECHIDMQEEVPICVSGIPGTGELAGGSLYEVDYNISRQDSTIAALICDIMDRSNIVEEARKDFLKMPLIDFCNIFKDDLPESEEPVKVFNLPKATVLGAPGKCTCPTCGRLGGLTIVDGILICRACNTQYGDIDTMPETI